MARATAHGTSGKASASGATSKAAAQRAPRRPAVSRKRLQLGARNAALCMAVRDSDRVFIITDDERMDIAPLVEEACREAGASAVTLRRIEEFGARPLTNFPDAMRRDIADFQPTVTYFIATTPPGELGLRQPMREFLVGGLKVRHGHMVGITPDVMVDGMCSDYEQVYRRTMQVYDIVKVAKTIHVTNAKGTDVTATLSPTLKWYPCNGRYDKPGAFGNLPEGEVFTSPATLEGTLVVDVLGDYFSPKYGVLRSPITFVVRDSRIAEISGRRKPLVEELHQHFWNAENGRRAGEFAIGTLEGLARLSGNLLQDEKMPGLHVAFGDPLGHFTGAEWHSPVHVDVVPSRCTVEVDGRVIMRDGVFTM
jgi:leucyl aminopeptidase (aminopeptidase T)